MELSIVAANGESTASVQLSDTTFARDYNEDLVHQVVTAYLAGARQGSKAQKTRSEVSGGGKKPWRQKGTGRARAGTIRSPIWVGGGRAFAAKPRDYSQKVNRKMYRAGVQTILSELARQGRLLLVESMQVSEPKTKLLAQTLKQMGVQDVLIVSDDLDLNLMLASRNLPKVDACEVADVNPVSLVSYEKIVMTLAAAKKFEEVLG